MRVAILIMSLVAALPDIVQAETFVLSNGTIHSGGEAGTLTGVDLLIEDGVITSIGAGFPVPSDSIQVDLAGKVVTPALIHAGSTLGAVEINDRANANDIDAASDALSAGVDIAYALNPNSTLIPIARASGIGRAIVTPGLQGKTGSNVRFGGQAALITTRANVDVLVTPRVAVTLNLLGSDRGRAAIFPQLKAMLDDAASYASTAEPHPPGAYTATKWTALDLDALVPVMRGDIPLVVAVDRASDIRWLLEIFADHDVKLVLHGAAEAWLLADSLASAGVSVILDPAENLPRNFDSVFATNANAARLHEAGVSIAIVGPPSGHDAELLRIHAGIAAANGLPADAALRAITSVPARMFGLSRVGQIAVGFEADLAIWSGDPFEPLSELEALILSGALQPLDNRQKTLGIKYRQTGSGSHNGKRPQ